MRIGPIAPPWIPVPPPAYGGIESIVDVLARGLAAAGHEVLLAAAAGSTCPGREVSENQEEGTKMQVEKPPVHTGVHNVHTPFGRTNTR